ncbi:MAG TPA: class C beta-lactamase [Puia sp.]|nr:class C beta-lactamase [Puia sp.]
MDDSVRQVVDSAVTPVMQEYNIAGMAIGVTINGERSFYNYGIASKETRQKVTDETLFEIGSVSKTFNVTLASFAQLTGYLSFGDRVSKYVPSLAGTAFDSVQLLDLGTHTAGGLPQQLPLEVTDSVKLIKYYREWHPDYPHGTFRVYSNASIGLLGIVTAKAMHQPYLDLVEKKLLPALGVKNSYINVPSDKMSKYAQGYNFADSPVRVNPGILDAESYGIKSCTKDLLQFAEVNMRIGKTTDLWQTAVMNTHTGYFNSGVLTQDLIWEQYNYPVDSATLIVGNSGEMSQKPNPATRISPDLPPQENVLINKTGSTNGFGAYILFVPSKKIGIVILANKSFAYAKRIRLALRILAELEKHP